jgi:hypothetical protein
VYLKLRGRTLTPKVIQKFHRIQLSDNIRGFIQSLPIKDVEETQIGNHIYLGYGQIEWGTSFIPVEIHIELNDNGMFTYIKTTKTGSIICPFNTIEEQKAAPVQILKILGRSWN